MPERVTKEERSISLAIEKARSAKEELLLSFENNRNPIRDESEHFKLKRPKAETAKDLIPDNQKEEAWGLGGQMTKFSKVKKMLKAILESDLNDNPVWNREGAETITAKLEEAHEQMSKILEEIDSGEANMDEQLVAIQSIIKTLEKFKMFSGGSIREGQEDRQTPHNIDTSQFDDPDEEDEFPLD